MPTNLDSWRRRVHVIIYESDTRAGRFFDISLIGAIVLSIFVLMIESIHGVKDGWHTTLKILEWVFTGVFTVEYLLRLSAVKNPLRYATSFFGIVDLASVLPTWLSIFYPGAHYFLALRVLRLLRIFRILKLSTYISQAEVLRKAMAESRQKIIVFLITVATLVVIVGTLMYVVEGQKNGFTSIPRGMYWAVVTLTTVGYGDISPHTTLGQVLASFVMIMGYGIIAVPTGIVTAQLAHIKAKPVSGQACPSCSLQGHDVDAKYCKFCGSTL